MMMQDANIAGWVFIAVVAFGVIAVALCRQATIPAFSILINRPAVSAFGQTGH
jgi:hypothetical protein